MAQNLSPPRQQPRERGFSFKSEKSNKSNGSKSKPDHSESPEDKRRRDSIWKTQSKANPNAAMTEAQPGDAHLWEQSTIDSLRGVQFKDVHGNPITDPDLSNPTRPRLERPLDTIRSFEKAIDNGYKRRSSMMRGESFDQGQNQQYQSRRSSYYGGEYPQTQRLPTRSSFANRVSVPGYDNGPSNGRMSQNGGYYGGRRPDSYADGPPQRMRYGNRMPSEAPGSRGSGVYPQHGYHQSHDTVGTGMTYGSDSTGPWANSTDPSSENSSLDRINATTKPQQESYGNNGYGNNGYGASNAYPGPIPEDGSYPQQYGGPVQSPGGPRRPIPLGNTGGADASAPPRSSLPSAARPEPEKRKSWLKRRFSKKE